MCLFDEKIWYEKVWCRGVLWVCMVVLLVVLIVILDLLTSMISLVVFGLLFVSGVVGVVCDMSGLVCLDGSCGVVGCC